MFLAEIFDSAADDPNPDKPKRLTGCVLALLVPAQVIVRPGPGQRFWGSKRSPYAGFQLFLKLRYAPVVEDVFKARQFPVGPIPKVPMNRYDCRANLK